MADLLELESRIKLAKSARRLSVYLLMAAFAIMGAWGFTPLKEVLPALFVLILFVFFSLVALGLTILSLYKGIQIKALRAKIEDS